MKQDEPKLLRVSKAAHELGLHPFTVRKWIRQGKIHAVWVGQEARVPRSEIERLVGKSDGRLLVLYGRVSGQGQKEDLETQLARLSAWAKAERSGKPTLILSDIGSGLKASRHHLQRLLKLVIEDQVAEIAVTYPIAYAVDNGYAQVPHSGKLDRHIESVKVNAAVGSDQGTAGKLKLCTLVANKGLDGAGEKHTGFATAPAQSW